MMSMMMTTSGKLRFPFASVAALCINSHCSSEPVRMFEGTVHRPPTATVAATLVRRLFRHDTASGNGVPVQ